MRNMMQRTILQGSTTAPDHKGNEMPSSSKEKGIRCDTRKENAGVLRTPSLAAIWHEYEIEAGTCQT